MKSVIFTTFFAILSQESQQNLMWKVIINSNLNQSLKLFFYSPILANNNMLFKIYCKNIMVAFFYCHFLFFILFLHLFFILFLIIIYSSYDHIQQLYFSMKSVISTTFFAILSQKLQ